MTNDNLSPGGAGVPDDESRDAFAPSAELLSYKKTVSREDHFSSDYKRRTSKGSSSGSTAGTSTASYTNGSSTNRVTRWGSTVGNIWNRLLQSDPSANGGWDGMSLGSSVTPIEISYKDRSPASSFLVAARAELRNFFGTLWAHPWMILAQIAVTALVAGLGLWALNTQRDAHVAERTAAARFVAEETADYFRNEFKRAFVPLYALRAAVQHSGYFDHLADDIGRYPNRLESTDVEIPGGLANIRDISGICDQEDVLMRWEDLLDASTKENDLEGLIIRYRLLPKNVACLEYKGGKAMVDSGMDMSNSNHPFWLGVVEDLFIKRWKGLHAFGPFAGPKPGQELFCTHLAIWNSDPNARDWTTEDGTVSLEKIGEDFIDIGGKEVEAWGFVMNYLDWGEMKKRSKIYERFSSVGLDFRLARRDEDVDPNKPGPKGSVTTAYAHLASSPNSDLLNDENSIVVETESMHGIWENRVGITSANGWNPTWYEPAVACVVIVAVLLGLLTTSTLVKSQLHKDLVKSMLPKKAIKKLQRDQTVVEKFNLITVFYADIVDYTGASGNWQTDSISVMNMLNNLFTDLDKIAKRHGVYRVSTTGSRYMVVGGAMETQSPREAATCVALFALDAMACVENKFTTDSGDKLFIRAGIASSPAVAGCVGKATPRYCFFGDAVDVASRMERTSRKMKIQCSEVTFRLLQDSKMKFVLNRREGADGEAIPLDTYWVEKASPCEDCFNLTTGSVVLDPCGHILCAGCNAAYNVCPTCRSKVNGRSKWTGGNQEDAERGVSDSGSCVFQTN